jgi:hypothetical protein
VAAVRAEAQKSVTDAEAAAAAQLARERERWDLERAVERKGWEVKVEAARVYAREREQERDSCQARLAALQEQQQHWQRQGQAAVARLQAEHNR